MIQVTAQYNLENADSEKEFKSLETKLAAVTASAKEQEVRQELDGIFLGNDDKRVIFRWS